MKVEIISEKRGLIVKVGKATLPGHYIGMIAAERAAARYINAYKTAPPVHKKGRPKGKKATAKQEKGK